MVDYLAKDVAEVLQQQNYNYIDVAGNAHIKVGELFIFIEGKKKKSKEKKIKAVLFKKRD